VLERAKDEPQATGAVCPKCKGRYGSVVKVQLRPQAVTMQCVGCGHQWFVEEPSDRTH